jgi:hypothetical protein
MFATSAVPSWFGRYSDSLFLLNVTLAGTTLLTVFSFWRGMLRTAVFLVMCMIVGTYLLMTNNSLLQIEHLLLILVIARVCLGLLWCWASFLSKDKQWSSKASNLVLAAGVSVTTFVLVDGVAALLLRPSVSGQAAFSSADFRVPVDLARIDPEAIVVVGDSMVWGQGVAAAKAFPELLHSLRRREGGPSTVYNLGVIGAGLETYLSILQRLPHKRQVLVCYYMNDIHERQRPGTKLRQALLAVGRGSALMKLAADAVGLGMYPDAELYSQSVVQDYDPSDPTFAARWRQVESLLSMIYVEAARDADRRPILVVIPMMWDFQSYPLRDTHARITELGRSLHFLVLDLLPELERKFPQGRDYLVGPNDNHFNEEVHAHIALVVSGLLASGFQ